MFKDLTQAINKEIKVIYGFIYRKLFFNPKIEKKLIEEFHKFYFYSRVIGETKWMGIRVLKIPFDLWVYQEIIYEKKPDIIIETGTGAGGSTLFLANICEIIGKGKIISVDVTRQNVPHHKRITYLLGSSISPEIITKIKLSIKKGDKVMAIMDSDHSKDYVVKELRIYSNLVTKGQYMIMEDTNVNGHPVFSDHGPGPMEGVVEFLKKEKRFKADISREKFYISQNPNGYLLKIR